MCRPPSSLCPPHVAVLHSSISGVSSEKDTGHLGLGPTVMPPFNSVTFLKALSPPWLA